MPSVVAEVGSTANEYQILAKLAMGGMAEIFLARGASTAGVERYVVLKRIIRDRANDSHFVQMFLEEARLAAQLQHANIAQVYDIGKLGDSYFFTMEYVHGETVRALLQRARSLRREIPLGIVLTVIAGTAAGLHYAHERIGFDGRPLNIVHRDVSPSNLMISYDGGVKVVDFGVAKAENRAQETRSGAVKGKISYLSPEQCRGLPIDRRCDLFMLGIVLWEMLTTERLYRRNSDFENMAAIVNEPPPPPSSRRPGLPPDVEQVALRLLAKNPEERYQSAEELLETIEEIAAKTGVVLSTSALGKFMKELFGQRPEPWIELETRDAAEGVTVTSEPIPTGLSEVLDPVEGQLRGVRDLSRQYAAQHGAGSDSRPPTSQSAAAMPPRSQLMTTPAMPVAPLPNDRLATMPLYRRADRPSIPPYGDGYAGTGSMMLAYPVRPSQSQAPLERPRNVKLIAAVAGGLVAIGVVVAVLAAGGGKDKAEPAGGVTAGPPESHGAIGGSLAPDAAVAAAPTDAAVTTAAAPDAAVTTAAPDAPAMSRVDRLKAALDADRALDALADCTATAPAGPDLAVACTLAACRAGDAPHAKEWLREAPKANRPRLEDECAKNAIDLKPPKVVRPVPRGGGEPKQDPCKVDPMACQH